MSEPALPLASLEDGQDWPAQGEWTYEDYLRLPDDGRRYEVIRGVLYVAPSPNYDHQFTIAKLTLRIGIFVEERGLGIVLMAPFDILLPAGIATPVQPDLLFFRKENRPQRGDKNFRGVPDLMVEVLSPSTRLYDRRIKLNAYRDAGVPEFWLVDPLTRTVVVYGWKEGQFIELDRGGAGDEVGSVVLSDFRLQVTGLFP
ncbi:MAG TPA: Uma2 family endonuclease [Thermoanaerobaculia bacterium]|nr:Uma2 family endonuclease [Thermoanaerobaculia bacterium]